MTYRHYYISENTDNRHWSVFSELYPSADAESPFDGTQMCIDDAMDSEDDAQQYAEALQRAEERRKS